MTTRITVAILLITWTILILGEAVAYVIARQTLLDLLDDSLVARATAVLSNRLHPEAGGAPVPPGDRYSVQDEVGLVVAQSQDTMALLPTARVIGKHFEEIGDQRVRTLVMRVWPTDANGKLAAPLEIRYSRGARAYESLLARLELVLLSLGVFCGLSSGWVALKVSRAALRPLVRTADAIAAIDEQHLDRRIDESALPVELVPMTRRLNEMLARLERVFTQRKQFLADAAHELRTPTAAMLTTIEVALRRQREPAALVEALQSSLADARLLRRLVERLMEHARSDRLLDQATEDVDVSALLGDCATTVEILAEKKGVRLVREFAEGLCLTTQRERLQSIVLNLLSNAVEYNRPGGEVAVTCRQNDSGLELSIRDTGEGIAADQLEHIFEPFFRGDPSRKSDEHLGLGLFLVQSHVQALGGRCEVDSKPGRGTTVKVTLPERAEARSHGTATPIPVQGRKTASAMPTV